MSQSTPTCTIKTPADELKTKATVLRDYADEFTEALDLVSNLEARFSAGEWRGLSFDELVKVSALNTERYGQYVQKLKDMADYLEAVAKKMAETDTAASTKIKSAG